MSEITQIPQLLEFAVNSGFTAVIFIIWYLSFKSTNANIERLTTQYTKSIEDLSLKNQKAYEDTISINHAREERLIAVIKDGHEINVSLHRQLVRLESKLDSPVRCPMVVAERRANVKGD